MKVLTNPTQLIDTQDPDTPPSEEKVGPSVAISVDRSLAGGATKTVGITALVIDENLASYSLAVNGVVLQSESDMTETRASINTTWDASATSGVSSGTYVITLDATDRAGKTSHEEVSFEVDNTAPTLAVSGGDTIVKSGSISPVTKADDAHGIASYTWTADSSNPAILDYDGAAAEPIFTPKVEGPYVFYLTAADGLGNTTVQAFKFEYAKELATIPLPTIQNPTNALIDQTPSDSSIGSVSPAIRSSHDETVPSDEKSVLGNTITATQKMPAVEAVATIAPTKNGWSIFGVLWYWWIGVLGLLFAGWLIVKKFVQSPVAELS